MRWSLGLLILTAGCFGPEDPATLPVDAVPFDPAIGAPEGWVVTPYELPLACPNGEWSSLYVVAPDVPTAAPLPVAVVFHSGSFDYVRVPDAADPLAGPHFRETDKLTRDWAVRRVFATLGMYPSDDPIEPHNGALPAALVEAGIPIVLPANCWGDHWHDYQGIAENDYGADLFSRNGRAAAEWSWRALTDPTFAVDQGIELPITVDATQLYAIGQGEGGRAVGELLWAGYTPAGVAVDSVPEDLRVYWGNEALYADVVAGLERVFPTGADETPIGALSWAVPPAKTAYLYSSQDDVLPVGIHDHAVATLTAGTHWVDDSQDRVHVRTAADLELSRQLVTYLTAE